MDSLEPPARGPVPNRARTEAELTKLSDGEHAVLLTRSVSQRAIRAVASALGSQRSHAGRKLPTLIGLVGVGGFRPYVGRKLPGPEWPGGWGGRHPIHDRWRTVTGGRP